MKQYYKIDPTLTAAPPGMKDQIYKPRQTFRNSCLLGFNSVQGVKSTSATPTQFLDNEFVIYNENQQTLRYLIEFTTAAAPAPKTTPALAPLSKNLFLGLNAETREEDITSEPNLGEAAAGAPKSGGEEPCGLVSAEGSRPVPLKRTCVFAKLLDMVGQVTILQVHFLF